MLSNFLTDDIGDQQQQQLWLNADTVSVSSLEMGSEYGEEDEEEDEGSGNGSYSSCSRSSCSHSHSHSGSHDEDSSLSTTSTSSSEEDEEVLPKRYSRRDRVKQLQKKQQQQQLKSDLYNQNHHHHHHHSRQRQQQQQKQQPKIKSCLRKSGMSSPDLMRRSTDSFGGLIVPGKPGAYPLKNTSTEKQSAAPPGLKKSSLVGGNARWEASTPAKKAGWNLLNDARIGMGDSSRDHNAATTKKTATRVSSLGLNSLKAQVLDVTVERTTKKIGPTKTTSLATKLNVTSVSVTVETPIVATTIAKTDDKKRLGDRPSSEPNLPGFRRSNTGPAIISRRTSERRSRRRNRKGTNSAQSSGDECSITPPSSVFGGKPAFRRCTSDPTSLIPKAKNDRWCSASPSNSQKSGRVRLDTKKNDNNNTSSSSGGGKVRDPSPTAEVMNRMHMSRGKDAAAAVVPAPARISRKARQSAPNLQNLRGNRQQQECNTVSSGGGVTHPGNNARWNSEATTGPARAAGAATADVGPTIPRTSAPNLRTLLESDNSSRQSQLQMSDISNFSYNANARWNPTPAPLKPKKMPGASAPNLLNLRKTFGIQEPTARGGGSNAPWPNQRTSSAAATNQLSTAMKRSPSASLLGTTRGGGNSGLTHNGAMKRTPSASLLGTARGGVNNGLTRSPSSLLGSSGGGGGLARTPSSMLKRGLQRTDSRMVGGSRLVNASAPNLSSLLNIRRTTTIPQDGKQANAQWGTQSGFPTPRNRLQHGATTLASSMSGSSPLASVLNGNHLSNAAGGGGGGLTRTAPQRGVQRTDSRMVGGGSRLVNASAPNLLNIRRTISIPHHGRANATWGAAAAAKQQTGPRLGSVFSSAAGSTTTLANSGGGLARGIPSPPRRGVHRTDSRLVGGSSLVNASAPNLLNIRRTTTIPQNRGANAQWGNRAPSGASVTARRVLSQTAEGNGRTDSSLLLQRGVQKTTSRMLKRSNIPNASAPNLAALSQSVSVPQTCTSMNAQWGSAATCSGMMARTSHSSRIGVNGPLHTQSTLMRAASHTRQHRMASSTTAPNLLNLVGRSASTPQNARWSSAAPSPVSTEQPTLQKHPRMKSFAADGGDMGLSRWDSNLARTERPGLRRSSTNPSPLANSAQWSPNGSSRRGLGAGPNLAMNPMTRSVTDAGPASSRWDSASMFDGNFPTSQQIATNTVAGGPPTSPPNANQLLRNHYERPRKNSLAESRSRIGASAPNLLVKRVYDISSEAGSGNAEWAARPSARQAAQQLVDVLGASENGMTGLEAMLDHSRKMAGRSTSTSSRWENGSTGNHSGRSFQMDQWSTTRRLPRRQANKSRNKKKKSHRHHHKSKKDSAPPQIRRTDTDEGELIEEPSPAREATTADAPPVPIKRSATDESKEQGEIAEEIVVDLVEEVTNMISSELEAGSAVGGDAVSQAAVSLAALEITRCARMALRKERSARSLVGGEEPDIPRPNPGVPCLGCSETIPEYPHTSDESVDDVSMPHRHYDYSDDDTLSRDDQSHQRPQHIVTSSRPHHIMTNPELEMNGVLLPEQYDEPMEAPVRSLSQHTERRESITDDEVEGVLMSMASPATFKKKKRKGGLTMPQRRQSIEVPDGLNSALLAFEEEDGDGSSADEVKPLKKPLHRGARANRPPKRKPSIDSTNSQVGRNTLTEESVSSHPGPLSHVLEEGSAMADCSDITMLTFSSATPKSKASLTHEISLPGRSQSLTKIVPKLSSSSSAGAGLNPYGLSKKTNSAYGLSKAILMHDNSSLSKSSTTSSSLLGGMTRMSDKSGSKSSNSSSNLFGSITSDVFSMLAAGIKEPVSDQKREKSGVADEEKPKPTDEKSEKVEERKSQTTTDKPGTVKAPLFELHGKVSEEKRKAADKSEEKRHTMADKPGTAKAPLFDLHCKVSEKKRETADEKSEEKLPTMDDKPGRVKAPLFALHDKMNEGKLEEADRASETIEEKKSLTADDKPETAKAPLFELHFKIGKEKPNTADEMSEIAKEARAQTVDRKPETAKAPLFELYPKVNAEKLEAADNKSATEKEAKTQRVEGKPETAKAPLVELHPKASEEKPPTAYDRFVAALEEDQEPSREGTEKEECREQEQSEHDAGDFAPDADVDINAGDLASEDQNEIPAERKTNSGDAGGVSSCASTSLKPEGSGTACGHGLPTRRPSDTTSLLPAVRRDGAVV